MRITLFTSLMFGVCSWIGLSAAPSQANTLPDGEGKQLTEQFCSSCHNTNRIVYSSGYSREGWQELISTMIDLPEDTSTLLSDYLAANFPPNNKRQPTLIDGNQVISFKEWVVPTLGQRPRDPVESVDGSIWWAGQWGNVIGRIDPKTDEMQEFTLPANAMPHTVTADAAGNIWYTGNKNGTIGRFNPATEEITEYPMPAPSARDPHSAIFDAKGTLWFTLQHSNQVGRLIPATGEVTLVPMPTPNAGPYGIKIDANGTLWVACNGSNCLVEVNPETMALKEYKLPGDNTKVRRLDLTSDGMIWYVNSSQGRLGRFNPNTGAVKEWPSPSGAKSHPYAIAVVNDVIWYNESAMRPDALVRFDPQTESFQNWAIPSGDIYAGIIRHMRKTADGNLLIHQGSTNRIMLVTLEN